VHAIARRDRLLRFSVRVRARPCVEAEIAVHLVERARQQIGLSRRHPCRARRALAALGRAALELGAEAA